jgi:hypothetical protein
MKLKLAVTTLFAVLILGLAAISAMPSLTLADEGSGDDSSMTGGDGTGGGSGQTGGDGTGGGSGEQ